MAYAEEDAERIFQTAIIGIAFIIGAAATLAITGPTILDNNPSSYIIITMIMGILFIFFTLKDKTPVVKGDYGVIGAAVVFMVYLIILSYAKGLLSFEFLYYRVDALLLPLLLLSLVMAVAGFRGIKRYSPVMAYLLFSSPILLLSILNTNTGLSTISAGIVSGLLKLLGTNVIQIGQQILAPSGQAIGIASTSVPIGTFIAFIMLLIPVSYLYSGNPSRKTAWLGTGVILLFVLNIIRMVLISLAWIHSNVGSSISTFHAIGGTLIFYITLIVMLLTYRKFGLALNWGKHWRKRLTLAFSAYDFEANYGKIATALIIALAVLFFSIGYLHIVTISSALFNSGAVISNSSYTQLYQGVFSRINASRVPYSYLGSYQDTMLFELGKSTPANSTYLLVSFYPSPEHGANVAFYTAKATPTYYIMRSGVTMTSLSTVSNNATFYISYFALPMLANGTAYSANFEVFSNAGAPGLAYCDPSLSGGTQEYIESSIYNFLKSGSPSRGPALCAAEKIALT